MKRIKKYFTTILLLTISFGYSHEGGHGKSDQTRVWKNKNNTPIFSAFFLAEKNNSIYFQDADGKTFSHDIANLSDSDTAFLLDKINHIRHLNGAPTLSKKPHRTLSEKNIFSNNYFTFGLFFIVSIFSFYLLKMKHNKKTTVLIPIIGLLISTSFFSCNNEGEDDIIFTDTENTNTTQSTSYEQIKTAFGIYGLATNLDGNYIRVESNGIPEHDMMTGITTWIAQFPVPHNYFGDDAWSIPLSAIYATTPMSIADNFHRGAIGLAANGIPIFNAYNASGLVSKDIGELDGFGGHSGRGDDYHYHTIPTHLEATSGKQAIAYALDGFAIYGNTEPDGESLDISSLEANYNGHEYTIDGVTSFHYHGKNSSPYMMDYLKGEVITDGNPAPENQIEPQPIGKSFRGDPHGISQNAIITSCIENSAGNGYTLSYAVNGTPGSVVYNWTSDNSSLSFTFNDINGQTSTEVFTRDAFIDTSSSSSTDFSVTSAAISNGELLDNYKCESKASDGTENSIPIAWKNIPDGTASLAVIMHHYPNAADATNDEKDPNTYILLWGIDPSVSSIGYGSADNGTWYMGPNKDGNTISYTSPCSPSAGSHEYTITVYALSETPSSLPTQSSLAVDYGTLYDAIKDVTLETASLIFNDVNE